MVCVAARRIPVIVVLGATGVGKSKLAIELATKFHGEIISADSMQIYKGLDIITNKVTREEQAAATHHMIDIVSPLVHNYTVVQFRNTALPIIDRIIKDNRVPVIVGGTNYYIESLLWDLLINSKSDAGVAPESGKSMPSSTTPVIPNDSIDGGTSRSQSDGCLRGDSIDGSTRRCPSELSVEEQYEEYNRLTTEEIHQKLCEVDLDSARRYHPKDRRKMLRALQVALQSGVTLSTLLAAQHAGGNRISGDLRYPDTLVFWITCQQEVLDERTNGRVADMIEKGLLQELLDFHELYNTHRLQNSAEADYTKGIFQSIGFKEFHEYLILPESERLTDHGQTLLAQGVELMKLATRQYARRQRKWVTSRMLKRPGTGTPPLYRLDATDLTEWDEKVLNPAQDVIQAFINGEESKYSPEPWQQDYNSRQHNVCDTCGLTFITTKEWEAHKVSRRHLRRVQKLKFEEYLRQQETEPDSTFKLTGRQYRKWKQRWEWKQEQQLKTAGNGTENNDKGTENCSSDSDSDGGDDSGLPRNSMLHSNSEDPGDSVLSSNSDIPSSTLPSNSDIPSSTLPSNSEMSSLAHFPTEDCNPETEESKQPEPGGQDPRYGP